MSALEPVYGTGGGAGSFVSESQEKLLQRINIKSDCIQRGEK